MRPANENLTGAINAFRRTIHIQPNHIWARYFLAACCLPARPDVAEAHLTTLLDERPELYSAWLLCAIAHANLGETAAAEDDFAAALERAPRGEQSAAFRYATLVIRGDFRTRRGDFAAAEQDLLEAARLKPDAPSWLYCTDCERTAWACANRQQLEQRSGRDSRSVKSGILLYRGNRFADADAARADRSINQAISVCRGPCLSGREPGEETSW
jgi:tetratricopeptide (TPR) repeat protein